MPEQTEAVRARAAQLPRREQAVPAGLSLAWSAQSQLLPYVEQGNLRNLLNYTVPPLIAFVGTYDAALVHVDQMLGKHGNDPRDFKLASKFAPEGAKTIEVVSPDGKRYDLEPNLADLGYAPKEGFHSAKFATGKPGLYLAAMTSDKVVNHGKPMRAVRSAKAFFLASPSLDKVYPGERFDKPLRHVLELVPTVNPVAPMGPGRPIKVKLLFAGKPMAGTKVSFIPRGVALKEGMDSVYERVTGENGEAAFTPTTGNYYLVIAHVARPESGKGYEATAYAAAMTVFVPEMCPCCGD